MSTYAQSPTKTVTGHNNIIYSYRRQGDAADRPLVLLQHFRGNLDNWDPALIDALSADREVITFDNIGVGATTGLTPTSITEMATGALAFIDALELTKVDLLGFSIGGFIAQELTLTRPDAVNRLILGSTAPQGAPGMHGWIPDIIEAVGSPKTTGPDLLHAFFKETETSQQAGTEYLRRFSERTVDRDVQTSWQTRNAHYDAIVRWGIHDTALLERLSSIRLPVFIANGDDDRMIPPRYSHLLAGLIDNATIKIYPDAAHGFLFQHHAEFAKDVQAFLSR